MKLAAILNFAGSLIPVIFPANEFKPARLVAVLTILATLIIGSCYVPMDDLKDIVDLTEDTMELTEQPK